MASFTLTNCMVLIGGTDLSDRVRSVTITDERDKVENTTMGSTANSYAKGLGDATITVGFVQDMAAGKVHATLQPLISTTTTTTVEVRAQNAARSATNPAFVLSSALMFNYTPLDGSIGDLSEMEVEFSNASGSGGMSYLTS